MDNSRKFARSIMLDGIRPIYVYGPYNAYLKGFVVLLALITGVMLSGGLRIFGIMPIQSITGIFVLVTITIIYFIDLRSGNRIRTLLVIISGAILQSAAALNEDFVRGLIVNFAKVPFISFLEFDTYLIVTLYFMAALHARRFSPRNAALFGRRFILTPFGQQSFSAFIVVVTVAYFVANSGPSRMRNSIRTASGKMGLIGRLNRNGKFVVMMRVFLLSFLSQLDRLAMNARSVVEERGFFLRHAREPSEFSLKSEDTIVVALPFFFVLGAFGIQP